MHLKKKDTLCIYLFIYPGMQHIIMLKDLLKHISKNLLNFYFLIKEHSLSVLHGTSYPPNKIFLVKGKLYMAVIIEHLFHFYSNLLSNTCSLALR